MRKRTKVALLLLFVVTVLGGTAYLLLKPSSPINPYAYRRIKEGMMQGEVQAVFGVPAGDYRDPERVAAGQFPSTILDCWGDFGQYLYPDAPMPIIGGAEDSALWLGNDYSVQVGFGRDGGVTGCLVSANRESVLSRLKAKLGW